MSERDPEEKLWKIFADRYSDIFSSANFVEYALPALALVFTIGVNVWLVFDYSIFGIADHVINNILISSCSVFLVGWLMYTTRFYQFFWGYRKIKCRFENRIAEMFEDDLPRDVAPDEIAGSYIYRVYWRQANTDDRRSSLRLHVNWVFLVHIAIVFVVSFIFLLGSVLYSVVVTKQPTMEIISNPIFIVVALGYILGYFYVRVAALKNLARSNKHIIDQVNRYRNEIKKDLPSNLGDILKPI